VVANSPDKPSKKNDPVSLDVERSRKFLKALAENPFITLVVTEDSGVTIYGKGLDQNTIERIKDALTEIQEGG
jgi:hypothetical protein